MAKKGEKASKIKQKKKSYWPAWLIGGLVGFALSFFAALVFILVTFKATFPASILWIANMIYAPASYTLLKIYPVFTQLGISFSIKSLFFTVIVFGLVFYSLLGALVGWLIKIISNKYYNKRK